LSLRIVFDLLVLLLQSVISEITTEIYKRFIYSSITTRVQKVLTAVYFQLSVPNGGSRRRIYGTDGGPSVVFLKTFQNGCQF
jgi:hypothetical protein